MTQLPAAGSSPQPDSEQAGSDSRTPARRQARSRESSASVENLLAILILAAGFIARIIPASRLFLNPDEALHNLLASQSTFSRAWDAALTNAHPPLLILLLYYWRALGHSEFWLRMPSVLAGTAACWLIYQWLKRVTDRSTAFLGLLLACFAPSLIRLSAEIRQYALLLFFMSACLYLYERALGKNSAALMVMFSLSLYGALLTHYSALIFAFAIGVYALVRFYPYGRSLRLFAVWGVGQAGGVAIATYFLTTHIPRLRQTGMVRADLESYLEKSVFHPGGRNAVVFVGEQTLRVFTYTFSHGLVGTLALLAFLAGMAWLLRPDTPPSPGEGPGGASPRELAVLLGLPFVVNWGLALAGFYPLGATRHDAFLAPFVIAGVCVGIAAWIPARNSFKYAGIALCLILCNLFPAPPPPIHARDQAAARMHDAISYLRASAPPGSAIFADYESGLLLGYYLCGHGVVQIFSPARPFSAADCGPNTVLATSFHEWKFLARTFPGELADATRFAKANGTLGPGTQIWFFYAGWINDSAPGLKKELGQSGCPDPKSFGENILVCRLQVTSTQ
jgi:hypothetical protein